jgi:hypothetical protein
LKSSSESADGQELTMDGNSNNGEIPIWCERCGIELKPGSGNFYLINIEALADPTPPVFSEDDLCRDSNAEISRLLQEMRDLSPQEALDQVYRRMVIYLCTQCYRQWIENPA